MTFGARLEELLNAMGKLLEIWFFCEMIKSRKTKRNAEAATLGSCSDDGFVFVVFYFTVTVKKKTWFRH